MCIRLEFDGIKIFGQCDSRIRPVFTNFHFRTLDRYDSWRHYILKLKNTKPLDRTLEKING